MDFGKLRDALRARPSLPPKNPDATDPNGDLPACPREEPCGSYCIHLFNCLRRHVSHESYAKLCSVVGCSAKTDAPLCPVGKCDGECLCREEVYTKLNALLINDALAELDEKTEETGAKDEL